VSLRPGVGDGRLDDIIQPAWRTELLDATAPDHGEDARDAMASRGRPSKEKLMRRVVSSVAVGLAWFSLVAIAPAQAAGPPRPTDFEGVSDACGFPVYVEMTGRVVYHESTDVDGNDRLIMNFMGVRATLTNMRSGKTITRQMNATFTLLQPADHTTSTSIYAGPMVWVFNPASWEPALLYTTGRIYIDADTYEQHGRTVDLCPLLVA
jgi:hypothetical protein